MYKIPQYVGDLLVFYNKWHKLLHVLYIKGHPIRLEKYKKLYIRYLRLLNKIYLNRDKPQYLGLF